MGALTLKHSEYVTIVETFEVIVGGKQKKTREIYFKVLFLQASAGIFSTLKKRKQEKNEDEALKKCKRNKKK